VQTRTALSGVPACTAIVDVAVSPCARPVALSTTRSRATSPGKYSASSSTGKPKPCCADGAGGVNFKPPSASDQTYGTVRAAAMIVAFSSAALGVKRSDAVGTPLG